MAAGLQEEESEYMMAGRLPSGKKEKSPNAKTLRKIEIQKLKVKAFMDKHAASGAPKSNLRPRPKPRSMLKPGLLRNLARKLKRVKSPKAGRLPSIVSLPFQAADVHEEVQKRVLRARRGLSEGRYGGET